MARSLGAALTAEFTARELSPIILVKMAFDSGDLNLWTGLGEITFDGDTYTGSGDLGQISPFSENADLAAEGLNFTISGIESSIISTALSEEYQGRTAKMWVGAIDETTGLMAGDPYLVFRGRMDVMEMQDQGETATITVSAETLLIALERANTRRYTPEDQRLRSSGDKGFDQVAALQDATVIWGRS